MKMKRNCNLELRLLPPSDYSFNPSSSTEQQKQMTIFFKGQMVVSDVTELQAKAIIHLASQEMRERLLTSPLNNSASPSPTTPLMQLHTPSPTGLSMKRSLQSFLHKRNNRVQATSPYYHHH